MSRTDRRFPELYVRWFALDSDHSSIPQPGPLRAGRLDQFSGGSPSDRGRLRELSRKIPNCSGHFRPKTVSNQRQPSIPERSTPVLWTDTCMPSTCKMGNWFGNIRRGMRSSLHPPSLMGRSSSEMRPENFTRSMPAQESPAGFFARAPGLFHPQTSFQDTSCSGPTINIFTVFQVREL